MLVDVKRLPAERRRSSPTACNLAVAGGDGDLIGEGGDDDDQAGDASSRGEDVQGDGDRGAGLGEAACRGGRGLILRT